MYVIYQEYRGYVPVEKFHSDGRRRYCEKINSDVRFFETYEEAKENCDTLERPLKVMFVDIHGDDREHVTEGYRVLESLKSLEGKTIDYINFSRGRLEVITQEGSVYIGTVKNNGGYVGSLESMRIPKVRELIHHKSVDLQFELKRMGLFDYEHHEKLMAKEKERREKEIEERELRLYERLKKKYG